VDRAEPHLETVCAALRALVCHPVDRLLRRWNWKSALMSSVCRALIFLAANLPAGKHAALSAMLTEFLFRALASGFYGALTQAFRFARPVWLATLTAMVLLPATAHLLEFVVHSTAGTERLAASIAASVAFSVVTTLFNLFAMRRGALIVGEGRATVAEDLRRMPRLIVAFCRAGARAIIGCRSNLFT
jgi:hypothetical protein